VNQAVFAARNVYDKLRKAAGDWEVARFYWRTYVLSRIEKVEPDVYVVSYPKCGRTWLRVMLEQYLRNARRGVELQTYNDRALLGIPGEGIVKFEHDKGNWVPAPLRVDQLRFNAARYEGKKVVFLVRDPRDVLVSSWYHLKYRERIYLGDLSEFIRDPLVGVHKVVAFTNMWLEHRDAPGGFCLMTYEQLHDDPAASFQQLLEFMGIEVEPDALRHAEEASSFRKMKKMELEGSLKEPWMRPGREHLDQSLKVRSGKIGSFQEELSAEDIAYLDEVIRSELSPELSMYYR